MQEFSSRTFVLIKFKLFLRSYACISFAFSLAIDISKLPSDPIQFIRVLLSVNNRNRSATIKESSIIDWVKLHTHDMNYITIYRSAIIISHDTTEVRKD